MDATPPLQPYSPFADWLSKFHTASEPIQALWIVGIVAVALGIVWALTLPLRIRLAGLRMRGELVYGVYRDRQGRWLVYADGEVRALDARVGRFERGLLERGATGEPSPR